MDLRACKKCCQCSKFWEAQAEFWKSRYLQSIDSFTHHPRHEHEESNIRISNDKAKANQD
jgi:hypothetical protein